MRVRNEPGVQFGLALRQVVLAADTRQGARIISLRSALILFGTPGLRPAPSRFPPSTEMSLYYFHFLPATIPIHTNR